MLKLSSSAGAGSSSRGKKYVNNNKRTWCMLRMKIVSFYCYIVSHYDFFAVSIVLGNIVIPVLVLNYVRIRYGKVSSSVKTRGAGALSMWPLIQ